MGGMFWVDTYDGGIINLVHVWCIRICDPSGCWIEDTTTHEADESSSEYGVSALLPTPPYRNKEDEEITASATLFLGSYEQCKAFEVSLKEILGISFLDIPNDEEELEDYELEKINLNAEDLI